MQRRPLAALQIRAATLDDLDDLIRVGTETYQEHFSQMWSPAGLEAFLAQHFGQRAVSVELCSNTVRYFLAWVDGSDAAVGFAKLRYPKPVPKREHMMGVELQKIYLRSSVLTRGVGAQLLAVCEDHTRELGLPVLWLDVLESNVRAREFYTRHGFQLAARLTFDVDL
ncbi:MAG: GNAT family N-acetyltransferase, partial [Polyangiales bacterium]